MDMVEEHRVSHNQIPPSVLAAALDDDAQTILDWLGSPVDEDKLKFVRLGATILHMTVCGKNKELASLLLQNGADVDAFDFHGSTPILQALKSSLTLANEIVILLYEWGASLQHHVPGEQGALADEFLQTLPIFHNELVKRRCEIINLNQRKDLNGQTCIVEKYIGKKNRYKVTTEHAQETFLVGPENLKQRDRTPEDPGYYVTFEDGEYKRHTFASNEVCQEFVRNLTAGRECD